jgi:hypothetical protein
MRDADLQAFYHALLAAVKGARVREGNWRLCERSGWPDNQCDLNLVAWCWTAGTERYLVVVNLSEDRSQGRVHVPWNDLAGRMWQLKDVLNEERFGRDGSEMQSAGLYVDVPAWGRYFLHFQSE